MASSWIHFRVLSHCKVVGSSWIHFNQIVINFTQQNLHCGCFIRIISSGQLLTLDTAFDNLCLLKIGLISFYRLSSGARVIIQSTTSSDDCEGSSNYRSAQWWWLYMFVLICFMMKQEGSRLLLCVDFICTICISIIFRCLGPFLNFNGMWMWLYFKKHAGEVWHQV